MVSAERTRVVLTFDVEPAEERRRPGGGHVPPVGYDLRVWGRFANQTRPLGLGWVLDALARHGQRATFFVEALGAAHFGEAALGDIVREIAGRDHDVQLHAHPVMKSATWVSQGQPPVADDFSDHPLCAQTEFLREGLAVLEGCGLPRAKLLAFRAGNYGANPDTWRAMAAVGLRVSSNFNLSYLGRGCRFDGVAADNRPFDTGFGVWELPITNFREPSGAHRLFQVTAVSFAEARAILLQAHSLRLPVVTVVSHLFEYFFVDAVAQRLGHANHINRWRLLRLLDFLAAHRDRFEVETVAGLADALTSLPAASGDAMPRGRRRDRYPRLVSQAAKRILSRLPL